MKFLTTISIAAAATLLSAPALAEWPEAPVKVVVPWAAGGLADSVARAFIGSIEENDLLPQPVAVVNVAGHFSIGMRRVRDAQADGQEFLLANVAIMAGEASGVMDFGFQEFEAIAETGESCFVPTVRTDSGINNIAALLKKAAGKDPVVVGVNIGANNHVAAAMLASAEDASEFRYTQTGGDTASFTALKGEQIDLAFLSAAAVSKFMMDEDGALDTSEFTPLAYMGEERHPSMPDLPTVNELGYNASFCIPLWWFAPKGTDAEIVAKFAETLEQAAGTERVQAFFSQRMMAPVFRSGEDFENRLQVLWKDVRPMAEQVTRAKK